MRIPDPFAAAPLAIVLPAAALLAGCGPSSTPAPAPSPSATPGGGDYVARVKALPSGQRTGVLFRAIRDAGQSCQQVVAEQALPAAKGGAWLATCDDRSRWVVSIADDGTAIVVDARTLRQPRS